MTNAFGNFFKEQGITEPMTEKKEEKTVVGKIIKVETKEDNGGWGFISSKEIPFTRIFFHWTSLRQDTLNFRQLKIGMKVEFVAVEMEGKGFRAIKIKVLESEKKAE